MYKLAKNNPIVAINLRVRDQLRQGHQSSQIPLNSNPRLPHRRSRPC